MEENKSSNIKNYPVLSKEEYESGCIAIFRKLNDEQYKIFTKQLADNVSYKLDMLRILIDDDTLFLQSYGVTNYNIKKCLLDRFDRQTVFKAMFICQNRIGIMLTKMDNLTNIVYDIISKEEPVSFSDLDINGDDIKDFDIEGKEVGKWLKFFQDYVWKNPKANRKSFLQEMLRKRKK